VPAQFQSFDEGFGGQDPLSWDRLANPALSQLSYTSTNEPKIAGKEKTQIRKL